MQLKNVIVNQVDKIGQFANFSRPPMPLIERAHTFQSSCTQAAIFKILPQGADLVKLGTRAILRRLTASFMPVLACEVKATEWPESVFKSPENRKKLETIVTLPTRQNFVLMLLIF